MEKYLCRKYRCFKYHMLDSRLTFRLKSVLAIIGVFALYTLFLSPLYYFFPQYTLHIGGGTVALVGLNVIHTSLSLTIQNWRTDFIEDEQINRYLDEEMEIVADDLSIKTPKVRIDPDRIMNASAMGLTQFTSEVHVTSELINNSTTEELRSTLAHEAAHIKNRDIFIMYVLYSPYKLIQGTHRWIIGMYNNERTNGRMILLPAIAVTYSLSYITLALIRLVSRQREFLADMKGAELTSPETEVRKLRKIEKYNSQVQRQMKNEELKELIQQFPLSVSDRIFSTHPNTKSRVENIHNEFFNKRT